jgi:hypothetical protein
MFNPSIRQQIPFADLGSPDLDVPTVLRARQAAAAYGHGHGLAQVAAIDAVAESERQIAAHVLAAILDAPAGVSPEGLSAAIAARLSAVCLCRAVR